MMLLAVYVGCLALGGVLIGASLIGGGGDQDADHDVDHGADTDLHHDHDLSHDHDLGHDHAHDLDHAGPDHGPAPADASVIHAVGSTLLSLRFWTFALAAFGLTGVVLHLLGVSSFVSLPVSVADGVLVGGLVTTMLRHAARDTVSSALDARQLGGRDAEVVLSVGPGKVGKIRLVHQGQTLELPATTQEDRLLERAERVIVVEVRGGTADVTPITPDRRAHTAQPLKH